MCVFARYLYETAVSSSCAMRAAGCVCVYSVWLDFFLLLEKHPSICLQGYRMQQAFLFRSRTLLYCGGFFILSSLRRQFFFLSEIPLFTLGEIYKTSTSVWTNLACWRYLEDKRKQNKVALNKAQRAVSVGSAD